MSNPIKVILSFRTTSLLSVFFVPLLTGHCQGLKATGKPCEVIIRDALAKAVKQHKRLFVEFGSSWCKPCKGLKAALAAPDMAHLLGKYLAFTSIDYQESKDHQNLENPGAIAWMRSHGVVPSLPAFAIVDSSGAVVVSSSSPSQKLKLDPIYGTPFHYGSIGIYLHFFSEGADGMKQEDLLALRHILEADIEASGKVPADSSSVATPSSGETKTTTPQRPGP